jgi:hypothetical protein
MQLRIFSLNITLKNYITFKITFRILISKLVRYKMSYVSYIFSLKITEINYIFNFDSLPSCNLVSTSADINIMLANVVENPICVR